MYLGLDRPAYPGDDVLAALRRTGLLSFVGVRLAPEPPASAQVPGGWLPHVKDLVAAGWGIAPTWGDADSTTWTASKGTADAGVTIALADAAGLARGTVVYLRLDVDGPLSKGCLEYVGAWAGAMRAGPHRPGLRCAAAQAPALTDAVGRLPVWVAQTEQAQTERTQPEQEQPEQEQPEQEQPEQEQHTVVALADEQAPDPGGSGYEQALVWQHRAERADLTWTDETGTAHSLDGVGLAAAVVPDPSRPLLAIPVVTGLAPAHGTTGDVVHVTGLDLFGVVAAAFEDVPATVLDGDGESALDVVVPAGLPAGRTVRLTVTNRWSLSGTSSDPFEITVGADQPGPSR